MLRSPAAAALPKDALDIKQPYVSGIYGSKYSIKLSEDYIREAAPFLSFLSDASGFSAGWTSDAIDPAHQIGDEFRARVLKDLPHHKFTLEEGTYYCSDLVRVILSKVKLIGPQDPHVRVTPSALFDILKDAGFEDVTDANYSIEAVKSISQEKLAITVRNHFDVMTGLTKRFGADHAFEDLWSVIEEQRAAMHKYLDDTQKDLFRIMGIPPSKSPESE